MRQSADRVVARSVWVAVATMVLIGAGCSNGSAGDAAPTSAAPSGRSGTSGATAGCAAREPEALQARVIRTIPHDVHAYTQGLVMHGGVLYESAGLYDTSSLRSIDPETGAEIASVPLPDGVFGEGLAVGDGGELVQLTWKEGRAFRWAPAATDSPGGALPSAPEGEFAYSGEGWGLTTLTDGTLLMSDGSDQLTVRDPADFSVIGTHRVTRSDGPTDELNELEWDGAALWANRYQTDELLRIDPECWTVTGVVDLEPLRQDANTIADRNATRIDVTNGVAQIPGTDRYLVTGKWWPTMYEVTFEPSA